MDRWIKPVLSTDVLLIIVLLIHFFYVINVLSIQVTLVHVSDPYLITCLMPVERGGHMIEFNSRDVQSFVLR